MDSSEMVISIHISILAAKAAASMHEHGSDSSEHLSMDSFEVALKYGVR